MKSELKCLKCRAAAGSAPTRAKVRFSMLMIGNSPWFTIYYLVSVAETVFVIPAEAGIQLFRSGPLLSQGWHRRFLLSATGTIYYWLFWIPDYDIRGQAWLGFLACICWYENVRFYAISFAYWRFMLACWLTYWYFNIVSNIVNKKTNKKALFLRFFCWQNGKEFAIIILT